MEEFSSYFDLPPIDTMALGVPIRKLTQYTEGFPSRLEVPSTDESKIEFGYIKDLDYP
jgi:hypothetical protein